MGKIINFEMKDTILFCDLCKNKEKCENSFIPNECFCFQKEINNLFLILKEVKNI